ISPLTPPPTSHTHPPPLPAPLPTYHARAATGELPPAPPASERPAFDQGQPSEPLIYRPLSVAALAALILAAGYAVFIAIGFLAEIGRHTSELQSKSNFVCGLLLEKK